MPSTIHPPALGRLLNSADRVRIFVGFLLAKAMPIVVAFIFIGTFLRDLISSQRTSTLAAGLILWIIFVISTVMILAESVGIFSLLRRQHNELKAAVSGTAEGDSHVQT